MWSMLAVATRKATRVPERSVSEAHASKRSALVQVDCRSQSESDCSSGERLMVGWPRTTAGTNKSWWGEKDNGELPGDAARASKARRA